ncbi:response regulator [Paenibacillus chartarius]|uniref:Response regulator n=1 Tax=Paenibacillus chartarius TaxID=747481 RepID=A0ABV6DN98_9BACL
MMNSMRAIVVDDHPLMAQATKQLLEQLEGIEVLGVAHDGKSGLDLVVRFMPDLVMLDYQLPDQEGSDLAAAIKEVSPKTHVVIFTGVDVSALMHRFLELEVSGVISKETKHTTIGHMLACIMDNHFVLPRSFTKSLLSNPVPEADYELAEEEVQLMNMLVRGATLEQIAQKLHISRRSVDNYQRKIFDKMGVRLRAQAIERFVHSKYYYEVGGAGK